MEVDETEMQTLSCDPSTDEVSFEDRPWYSIDTEMISSKCSYFLQNAKDSCYLPYMILFLTGTGLTPQQAGTVNGLRFIGFIIGAPLWGMMADYKGKHSIVMFILCLGSLFLMTSLPFVTIPLNQNKHCVAETTTTPNLNSTTGNMTAPYSTTSGKFLLRNETPTFLGKDNTYLFVTMIVVTLLVSCFDGSTQGFVDAGVVQKISSNSRGATFGVQRLFGAIGYGVGAFASSLAMELSGVGWSLPCYTPVFLVYGILVLALTISTNRLFTSISFKPQREAAELLQQNESIGTVLMRTLSSFSVLFFLTTVLIVGTIHAVYIGFLFVLLRDINCPNVVMGVAIVVAALASTVGIKISEFFIDAFEGTIRVLSLGCLSWAIRFLLLFYLQNPWLVLPIQLLQGFGYGMFIAVSVIHIKRLCCPRVYTSMYGIFNGLFFGGGALIGNVIGGAVVMEYGIRTLFMGTSIAGFVWTIAMIVYLAAVQD